jgi:hypothetical protein
MPGDNEKDREAPSIRLVRFFIWACTYRYFFLGGRSDFLFLVVVW